MIDRCCNPNSKDRRNYSERGIRVCAEWRKDFPSFLGHIGPRPSAKHSLDRIDNDGNYEPGNVRWATVSEQRANTRPVILARQRKKERQTKKVFAGIVASAGITRKQLGELWQLSKTSIDLMLNGTKYDPMSRTREIVAYFRSIGREDLANKIVVHICGGDDFDGRVLTPAQVDALRELVKAVK